MTLRIGELFAGVGGLGMGVTSVIGGEIAWFSEYDQAPSRILAHHFPTVPNHGDITAIDWADVEPPDVLTGGYPCQPFSLIGKRKGKNDERHLWPYYATAIRELRPRLAVLENVAGHLSLGFDRVLGDLAELGYDTNWIRLPASAAGAPHKRERVFVAAYPADKPWRFGDGDDLRPWGDKGQQLSFTRSGTHADANNLRGDRNRIARDGRDEPPYPRLDDAVWRNHTTAIRHWELVTGRHAPWPGHPGGGVATEFSEWLMGWPRGWVTGHGLTREQEAHIIGNGVVPQQAALALRHLLKEPT